MRDPVKKFQKGQWGFLTLGQKSSESSQACAKFVQRFYDGVE